MDKIKALYQKYRQIIFYVIFGAVTTLTNILGYFLLSRLLLAAHMTEEASMNIANISALALSILVAYLTNRKWVFRSSARGTRAIALEAARFFAARVLTVLLDMGLMNLTVVAWRLNDMLMKILINVLVVVLNYVLSKLLVFRKKRASA
nr:GtrA family protein [Maliibacterium massiliense]